MSIETRASLLMRLRSPEDTAAWADFLAIYEPVIYHTRRPAANRLPTALTHRRQRRRVSPKLAAAAALVALIPATALGIYLFAGRPPETAESQLAAVPVQEPAAEAGSDIPLAFDALDPPLAALADRIEQLHRAVADDLKVESFTLSEETNDE